jgi:Tfp pilus assembly protein PilX
VVAGLCAVLLVFWFAVARKRFSGPPHGITSKEQEQAIAAAEAAVHEGEKEMVLE